jgi:murein DD-endopeptidase MepM/ murein hydrolase activator NlpD
MENYIRPKKLEPGPKSLGERFGIRSAEQLKTDYAEFARNYIRNGCFRTGVSAGGILRADLSFPALMGLVPSDGLAPILDFVDRTVSGLEYSYRTSRKTCRDYRGGRLTYDAHDGTDLVIPIGTPLVAAAPGTVVMIHDRWLRGGITVAVDHGLGLVTQYTHCTRPVLGVGDKVRRGETVAISGTTGFDMTHFFPWVPPHIHFTVFYNGRPVDPFFAEGDRRHPGLWRDGNEPKTAAPDASEPIPEIGPIALDAMEKAIAACTDSRIKGKCAERREYLPGLAAFVEDALHHDRWAWPKEFANFTIRPKLCAGAPALNHVGGLTLPLPHEDYKGVRPADSWWTRFW